MTVNRIRLDADAVLDQKEVRMYVWNEDYVRWEPYSGVVEVSGTSFECIGFPDDLVWTVTIDAAEEANVAETDGMCTLGIGISGTWVGTLIFEGTLDGTNYYAIPCLNPTTGALSTTTTTNGIFIAPCAGLFRMRLRASLWTSGSAVTKLRASIVPNMGLGWII